MNIKVIIATDAWTRDENVKYNINREAQKVLPLISGKTQNYEYWTSEEILPSDQRKKIKQANLNFYSLGKTFEKWVNTMEEQGKNETKLCKFWIRLLNKQNSKN